MNIADEHQIEIFNLEFKFISSTQCESKKNTILDCICFRVFILWMPLFWVWQQYFLRSNSWTKTCAVDVDSLGAANTYCLWLLVHIVCSIRVFREFYCLHKNIGDTSNRSKFENRRRKIFSPLGFFWVQMITKLTQ